MLRGISSKNNPQRNTEASWSVYVTGVLSVLYSFFFYNYYYFNSFYALFYLFIFTYLLSIYLFMYICLPVVLVDCFRGFLDGCCMARGCTGERFIMIFIASGRRETVHHLRHHFSELNKPTWMNYMPWASFFYKCVSKWRHTHTRWIIRKLRWLKETFAPLRVFARKIEVIVIITDTFCFVFYRLFQF